MQKTIDETNRRREKQIKYNEAHGIVPQQIIKKKTSVLTKEVAAVEATAYVEPDYFTVAAEAEAEYISKEDLNTQIEKTKKAMSAAAKKLEFLEAARLRDMLIVLENKLNEIK